MPSQRVRETLVDFILASGLPYGHFLQKYHETDAERHSQIQLTVQASNLKGISLVN